MSPQHTELLRIASVPVCLWTDGGSSDLLDLITRADLARDRYNRLAEQTAVRIGDAVVPREDLTKAERAQALRVRRSLHRGVGHDLVDWHRQSAQLDELADVARRGPGGTQLAEEIATTLQAGALAVREWQSAQAAVHAELERTGRLPWETAQKTQVLWQTLAEDHPDVTADIRRRLAEGEHWDGKQLRKRSDFLWRLITRAATKTTPRGWLTHVAPLRIHATRTKTTTVADALAVHRVENLYTARRRHALPSGAADAAAYDGTHCANSGTCSCPRVSLAPLHRVEVEALVVWTQQDRGRLERFRIRRTPVLSAALTRLSDGPVPWHELRQPPDTGTTRLSADAWSKFLEHLITLGVLQAQGMAAESKPAWSPLPDVRPAESTPDTDASPAFTDVYRQAADLTLQPGPRRLQELLAHASRLADLLYDEASPSVQDSNVLALLSDEPRPVLDILHEYVTGNAPQTREGGAHTHGRWPKPNLGDSPYARVVDHIARSAEASPGTIDLTPGLLDRLGVPAHSPVWPMTAMLRPMGSEGSESVVLDAVMPSGVIDSRFAGALSLLHPDREDGDEYRAFLSGLEDRSGAAFVEICVPSLGTHSANAVRRPEYTSLWTGDTDRTLYYAPLDRHAAMRHVALGAITMRRDGGRPIAEAEGTTLWPVLHATKGMEPPWDTLGGLLLAAGPRRLLRPFKLGGVLAALPSLASLPRVTLGGELVISCAQWRVPVAEILPPGASVPLQMLMLARLQRDRGVPRWVFATTYFGGKPVAVDLCSVLAPRLLDRMAADSPTGDLVLEEMLPQPGASPFTDERGEGLTAEITMRFPADPTGDGLAAAVSPGLCRRLLPERK
ncbi:hypothetical protein ACF9IK_09470 [Kitasatospora hibisci]|uniref:hypothetical protein n=1 Tax=Kitasatospora hibisci TaxID=3369522 RepID=UPI00375519F8